MKIKKSPLTPSESSRTDLFQRGDLQGFKDSRGQGVTGQKGSALIITILLITILTGLVVDFVYDVYIDSTRLSNWSNAQRASLIAQSGQTLSSEFITIINKQKYTDIRSLTLPVVQDFGPDTALTVKIEDESSKFNVNSIIYPNGLTNEKAFSSLKKLFEYLNINSSLALSIADWIDPDKEPRLFDSEDNAKNTFLWSVDELRSIDGLNSEIFGRISPYLTVYGNNLVNINTAELPVLVSLDSSMTELLAKSIIEYRENFPFESTADVQNLSGMEIIGQRILGSIVVRAAGFRVTARARVHEITRIIESVMDKSGKIEFWREG